MELAHKYVYLYNERIVIYLDTPWIQQLMYASMKIAGFVTLTVRSTDKQGAKIKALRLFTDPHSKTQILVANINIMATGVNLHDACRVGVIPGHLQAPRNLLRFQPRALVRQHYLADRPGLLHSYMALMSTQQTALPGSLPEKKNAQLSAIARDQETAMMKAEREKNTGPKADQDISMEKLRDMRGQLRHQTLATVSIAN
ncbi:uncharacterized protein T069G_10820 [Trichoderma breve]|uniref:Helicase C-terminal domain-containing protein n=1 Tax=Trichoderma breve TaxID=2034170 RepID=A0A9W9E3K4_9HYPO|nr:uncharacterized protein T069G_10820 [Trichoderma breve]KAJ4855262.1 hypothetical protein T069G_10820 [Trichoderma breve]